MSAARQGIVGRFGLGRCPPFHRDRLFHLALGAGLVFWGALWGWGAVAPVSAADMVSPIFFSLVIWQPLLEELCFRGYLQGRLGQHPWGQHTYLGVTRANLLVSLVFVFGHFWAHPPLWALAVFGPSLLFGAMRDRSDSVYPAIVLHIFYNAGYFGLTGYR